MAPKNIPIGSKKNKLEEKKKEENKKKKVVENKKIKQLTQEEIKKRTGIKFRISLCKKWMKEHIKLHYPENDDKKMINFRNPGPHYAIIVIFEILYKKFLENAKERTTKDISGLYKIIPQTIVDTINSDEELYLAYYAFLRSYDKNMNYIKQLPILENEYKNYIESLYGNDISVSKSALNLISYLISKTITRCTNFAVENVKHYKRRSLDIWAIYNTLKIFFEGATIKTFYLRISNIVSNLKDIDIEKIKIDHSFDDNENNIKQNDNVNMDTLNKKSKKKNDNEDEKKINPKIKNKIKKDNKKDNKKGNEELEDEELEDEKSEDEKSEDEELEDEETEDEETEDEESENEETDDDESVKE